MGGHKHGSVYNWKGKNFRGIHCQGCSLVKLYDDDKKKHHRQHKELKCCTGKTCDFTDARGWFHDLRAISLRSSSCPSARLPKTRLKSRRGVCKEEHDFNKHSDPRYRERENMSIHKQL